MENMRHFVQRQIENDFFLLKKVIMIPKVYLVQGVLQFILAFWRKNETEIYAANCLIIGIPMKTQKCVPLEFTC